MIVTLSLLFVSSRREPIHQWHQIFGVAHCRNHDR